ncbi:hypothetical protein H8356DRAFT_1435966 [Neocallimastix lanati (nom. inval.)]|nr:hypothetical protein H8356DRAFT_1435966 [Neocallimastix sp. JGI-2020a]
MYQHGNIEVVTTPRISRSCPGWTTLLSVQYCRSNIHIIAENFLERFFSECFSTIFAQSSKAYRNPGKWLNGRIEPGALCILAK